MIFDDNDEITAPNKIKDIIEKPVIDTVKSSWVLACRYILSPKIFNALQDIKFDNQDELQLTTAIRHMVQNGRSVWGYPFPKELKRYDTGNFEGYVEAFGDFAREANITKDD